MCYGAVLGAWLFAAAVQAGPAKKEEVQVDEKEGKVVVPARVAKQGQYEDKLKGVIEYIATLPGGKEYECLFVCPIDPMALHDGLKKIGLKTGKPWREEGGKKVPPEGSPLRIWVEWKDGEQAQRVAVESFVWDTTKDKPMEPVKWVFTGSREGYDPVLEKSVLQVTMTKNLIALHTSDGTTLIQNPLDAGDQGHRFKTNKKALPKEGLAVRLVFEAAK